MPCRHRRNSCSGVPLRSLHYTDFGFCLGSMGLSCKKNKKSIASSLRFPHLSQQLCLQCTVQLACDPFERSSKFIADKSHGPNKYKYKLLLFRTISSSFMNPARICQHCGRCFQQKIQQNSTKFTRSSCHSLPHIKLSALTSDIAHFSANLNAQKRFEPPPFSGESRAITCRFFP